MPKEVVFFRMSSSAIVLATCLSILVSSDFPKAFFAGHFKASFSVRFQACRKGRISVSVAIISRLLILIISVTCYGLFVKGRFISYHSITGEDDKKQTESKA